MPLSRTKPNEFRGEPVPYYRQMKPRRTTWLLAALMLACAAFGLPASRIASGRESFQVVCLDHRAPRQRREIPERRRNDTPVQVRSAPLPFPVHQPARPASIAALARFQRPPPPALFSRT